MPFSGRNILSCLQNWTAPNSEFIWEGVSRYCLRKNITVPHFPLPFFFSLPLLEESVFILFFLVYCCLLNLEKTEATSKNNLILPFMGKESLLTLSSTLSTLLLKAFSGDDSTTYLGRLFQWVIVLTVKKFFIMSRWNLSQYNLFPSSPVFPIWLLVKREHLSPLLPPFKYWDTVMSSLLSILFFTNKWSNSFSLSSYSGFFSPS